MGSNLTHTISGNIASFKCADTMPIESLKVNFLPVQEGSGDPSPENVRNIVGWQGVNVITTGKNIVPFSKTAIGPYDQYINGQGQWQSNSSSIDKAVQGKTITFSVYIDATNAEEEGINYYSCVKIWAKKPDGTWGYLAREGTKIYKGESGWSVLTETLNDTYYDYAFGIGLRIGATARDPMVEYGSERTAYEPYCGQTIPVTFPVLGKNKCPLTSSSTITSINTNYDNTLIRTLTPGTIYQGISANNYWLGQGAKTFVKSIENGTMTYQASGGGYGNGICIKVIPSTTYILSYTQNAAIQTRIGQYKINGEWTGLHQVQMNGSSFTTGKDTEYIILVMTIVSSDYRDQDITISNLQLELGDTATTYEPYSSANTVYGGYIDLTKGELVATYGSIDLGTLNWASRGTSTEPWFGATSNLDNFKQHSTYYHQINMMCPIYKTGTTNSVPQTNYEITVTKDSSQLRIRNENYSDPSDLKTHLNNVILVYELANPITYPLSKSQLQTLLVQNNIWSNTNSTTEVTYAFQDHLSKQRINMRQPHLATASGAIASFNTDMKAPLKSAKIYFNPIQKGSGDPSPENMRNINGWTALNISQATNNLGTIQQILGTRPYELVTEDNRNCVYVRASGETGESLVNAFKSNTQYTMQFDGKYVKSPTATTDPISPFRMWFVYTDDTTSLIDISNSHINTWHTYSFTSTANKTIKCIRLGNYEYRAYVYFDIDTFIIKESTSTNIFEPYVGQALPITWINWNQIGDDGQFTNTNKWRAGNVDYGTLSLANNIATWTCTTEPTQYYHTGIMHKTNYLQIPYNHKVLVMAQVRSSIATDIRIYGLVSSTGNAHTYSYKQSVEANEWTNIVGFIANRPQDPPSDIDDTIIKRFKILLMNPNLVTVGTTLEAKNFMAFDLTQMFGTGHEPTIEEFRKQFSNTYYPYTLGESGTGNAGILYGGYVDLISGTLVRNWLINTHEIGAKDGTPGGSGTGGNTDYRFIAWNLASAHLPDTERTSQAVCNIAPYIFNWSAGATTRFWLGGGTVYMVLPNDNQAYTATVAYAERDLNIDIYQLTPQQINSLKGINNIWSSANGAVDIKYWTH